MKIFITGGTGFVGGHAKTHFLEQGHAVTVVGTRSSPEGMDHARCRYVQADTTEAGDWQAEAAEADLILNLAGRTIFRRWSESYKGKIRDSRIKTTRHLVDALPTDSKAVLISTSAVGYYGDCGEAVITEQNAIGDDFLASLAKAWEAEAMRAADKGVRVIIARFGIILGHDGGALASMVPAFRSFVGGPLGTGKQWFPWLHIHDLLAAYDFLYGRADLQGAFNFCSPNPVRNREMAQTLGSVLHRPAVMPVPTMALKLMLGELANALLASQRAVPAKLLAAGFEFKYPELADALTDILGSAAD
jgi:uncharacterized protein